MGWIRDALSAARTIRQLRKSGNDEPLALVSSVELDNDRYWLAQRDWENQLMQRCIIGMTQYETPCTFCEEHAHGCLQPQHNGKGCKNWWLRFLTEDELEACRQRAEHGQIGSEVEPDAADSDRTDLQQS